MSSLAVELAYVADLVRHHSIYKVTATNDPLCGVVHCCLLGRLLPQTAIYRAPTDQRASAEPSSRLQVLLQFVIPGATDPRILGSLIRGPAPTRGAHMKPECEVGLIAGVQHSDGHFKARCSMC